MNENHEKDNDQNNDDLQNYLKEMENLKADFSDLGKIDLNELKEMKQAIESVKQEEEKSSFEEESEIKRSPEISQDLEEKIKQELRKRKKEKDNDQKNDDLQNYIKEMENLEADFSDLGKIDLDELKEMKQAIESVKQEEEKSLFEEESEIKRSPGISQDLEEKIKQELRKRKEEKEEKEETAITPEKFLGYVKSRRDKIWYHALYYLVFKVEDHIASKSLLYDVLKEVTSKSAIDPIPEHQFYFGLGHILRLSLNNKKIIRYMSGGKFKVNVNINELKEILEKAGAPISTRPVIEEDQKKEMFRDFLKDDFLDI